MSRGGKREGAGRPKSNTKPMLRNVTDQEREAIDKLLKNMRKTAK